MLSTIIFFMFANFFFDTRCYLLLQNNRDSFGVYFQLQYPNVEHHYGDNTFRVSVNIFDDTFLVLVFFALYLVVFIFRSSCFSSHGYNLSVLIYVNKIVFVFLHLSLCSHKIFLSIISISYYGLSNSAIFMYFHSLYSLNVMHFSVEYN